MRARTHERTHAHTCMSPPTPPHPQGHSSARTNFNDDWDHLCGSRDPHSGKIAFS